MIYDLQKANMWKRISAFLFDGILLGILAVLFAWLLSMILRYDNWNNKLNDAYARYGEEYGVAFDISLSEYEALSPEEVEKLNAAYQAIGQDPEAVSCAPKASRFQMSHCLYVQFWASMPSRL